MMESSLEAAVDFVAALCFVPRGIAKERPEKITLTTAELRDVIDDGSTHSSNDEVENVGISEVMATNDGSESGVGDEFKFRNYDNENTPHLARISNIVDPENQLDDEDDSEAEDEIIKQSDNLILVGRVQDDSSALEVWVFNEEEESLYTHHDFLLPSFPLCIEWMNRDPSNDKAANMCAIGSMDPIITVWDLDIEDSLEASFKLGSKKSKKRKTDGFGHKDAVLDLSWNRQYEHILASASADQTVILWDVDVGMPHSQIDAFAERVQTLEFHPKEAQSVLAGAADGLIQLFDCRDPSNINECCSKWLINGEVEKIVWHPMDWNYFIVGNNVGDLNLVDKRNPTNFLWSRQQAHSKDISGICFNSLAQNLLTTTSTDGTLKIWNCNSSELREVYSYDLNMGRILCMTQCPEDPFTLAFGGEKAPRCRVLNIKNFEAVRHVFHV